MQKNVTKKMALTAMLACLALRPEHLCLFPAWHRSALRGMSLQRFW